MQTVEYLDAEPFIAKLLKDERQQAIPTGMISRWREKGISIYAADKWSIKLGYHPYEIWGQDFYRNCHEGLQDA